MGRFIVYLGLILVLVGFAWPLIERIGLGRLPGDFVLERDRFKSQRLET